MKVWDKNVLKLSVTWGLILGFISLGLGMWLGLGWWIKQWRLLREVLGLSLGVVYTVNFKQEILEMKVKYLVVKYGMFVYWVVLVWLGWLVLVWVVGEGQAAEFGGQGLGVIGGLNRLSQLGFYLEAILQAVKVVGLGLVVVLGWRVINSKVKI